MERILRSASGSSPHTRGAPDDGAQFGRRSGIIPAYAGSTSPPTDDRKRPKDHPRIRGEHHLGASICTSASGSSPHTRGAPLDPLPFVFAARIIPAYAGSTRKYQQDKAWRSDHPRIRGEHPICVISAV